jgi:hypothetical protein
VTLFSLVALIASSFALSVSSSIAQASSTSNFTTGVLAPPPPGSTSNNNIAAEPQVRADAGGNFYATSENGVGAGTDAWKSTDGGLTYSSLAQPNGVSTAQVSATTGVAPGGGDTDLATAPVLNGTTSNSHYNVYVASLTVGSVTVSASVDGGLTWQSNELAATLAGDDREWIAPFGASGYYVSYHNLPSGDSIAVNEGQLVNGVPTSVATYSAINPDQTDIYLGTYLDNEIGNMVVDQATGDVYQVFVGCPPSATAIATCSNYNTVYLAVGAPVGVSAAGMPVLSFTDYVVYESPNPNATFDNNFPNVAVDQAGNVYVAWSDDQNVDIAYSKDSGQSFSAPVQVNSGSAVTAIFPWMTAGSSGAVDLVYYGTPAAQNYQACATTTATYTCQNEPWSVYFAQNLHVTGNGTWAQQPITPVVHYGGVCQGGVTCSSTGNDNRDLYDDFGVAASPTTGLASVIYSDDQYANNVGTANSGECTSSQDNTVSCDHTSFATQTSGPGIFSNPTPPRIKAPSYTLANVGAFGGEPSITANSKGELYDTTPSGGTLLYKSTNAGATWTQAATADASSGDDCVFTDQTNALYLCNLAGSQSTGPLQADVWKSLNDGQSWNYGTNEIDVAGGSNVCGTSCSPFGVDRPWADAYVARGGTTNNATVVLMYHDFFGPSQIWVNVSSDGGKTFAKPVNVLANMTTTAADQGAVAEADSACNTVPAGLAIAKGGAHPGRIYAAWIASDPESAGTGCNVTMVQSFHNLFVAWSDNGGLTWTPQLAYDAGVGHDASTPFVSFTLDNQGNPYFAFATPAETDNPTTCATESTAGTVQSDPTCDYHMWVAWSSNGGTTWDGGGGVLPGTAAAAYEVDPSGGPQTDVFPAIAAGNPGEVDVAWLRTFVTEPTDALGKFDQGGCAGPGPSNGNPTFYPPECQWNLWASQSLDLTAPIGQAAWASGAVTTTPMHIGDICNLGIFCVAPSSNRNLLDYISETIDPTTGFAHIAFADDNTVNKLRVANQTSGPSVLKSPPH